MKKRFIRRFGHRGIALALLGFLWVLTAVGIALAPLERGRLLDERLPVWLRVALWGVPGLLAVAAAFWRSLDADAWGWLLVPVVVRFLSFFAGWVFSLAGKESGAYPDGWRGAITTAVFIVFIMTCAAGLDRPQPPPVRREA